MASVHGFYWNNEIPRHLLSTIIYCVIITIRFSPCGRNGLDNARLSIWLHIDSAQCDLELGCNHRLREDVTLVLTSGAVLRCDVKIRVVRDVVQQAYAAPLSAL